MALQSLSEFDLGWLVGILDGEGCFSLGASANRKDEPDARMLRISCSMTDLDTIERLHSLAGVGAVYPGSRDQRRPNSKPLYVWHVGKRADVVALMHLVKPHMSERRQGRIQELLDHADGHPIRYKRELPHGVIAHYRRGCRCAECLPVGRAHNAERARNYRRKQREANQDQAH